MTTSIPDAELIRRLCAEACRSSSDGDLLQAAADRLAELSTPTPGLEEMRRALEMVGKHANRALCDNHLTARVALDEIEKFVMLTLALNSSPPIQGERQKALEEAAQVADQYEDYGAEARAAKYKMATAIRALINQPATKE